MLSCLRCRNTLTVKQTFGDASNGIKTSDAFINGTTQRRNVCAILKAKVLYIGPNGKAVVPTIEAAKHDHVDSFQATKWRYQELAAFLAASHLSFANAEHIALTRDAARIGQPGKEREIILAENLDKIDCVFGLGNGY